MKEVEKKYQHLFEFDEDGNPYITEYNLENLTISDFQKEELLKYIRENNISVFEDYKNRPKLVHDHELEYDDAEEFSQYQIPRYADINFDQAGNVISEDYSELDTIVDEELVPNHVVMKIKRTKDGKEYYPSIRLMDILALQLSEIENKHVIEYLESQGIPVAGIDQNFEENPNYTYVLTHKTKNLPIKEQASEEQLKKLNDEKTPLSEKRRIKQEIRDKSYAEETALFQKLHDSETPEPERQKIREKIIMNNMRLVPYFIWKYYKKNNVMDLEELESYGYEGLINAVDKFDETKGYRFISYAIWWIRGKISRGIKEKFNNNNQYIDKFLISKRMYEQETNTNLKDNPEILEDILEFMSRAYGYNENVISHIRTLVNRNINWISIIDSEDNPENEDNPTLSDNISYEIQPSFDRVIKSDEYPDPEDYEEIAIDNADLAYFKKQIDEILTGNSNLTKQEITVLTKRFGLDGNEPQSIDNVAKLLNLSRGRIFQVEQKARRKLKLNKKLKALTEEKVYTTDWEKNYKIISDFESYELNNPLFKPEFLPPEKATELRYWIEYQRFAYRGKEDERRYQMLDKLGMIWDYSENRLKINEICEKYSININQEDNKKYFEFMSYKELQARINYLISTNRSLIREDGSFNYLNIYDASSFIKYYYDRNPSKDRRSRFF